MGFPTKDGKTKSGKTASGMNDDGKADFFDGRLKYYSLIRLSRPAFYSIILFATVVSNESDDLQHFIGLNRSFSVQFLFTIKVEKLHSGSSF